MSARDVIAGAIQLPGPMNRRAEADNILSALRAAGYVVAKVPVEATVEVINDIPAENVSGKFKTGFRIGWNACRAAMLKSAEEGE